MTIIKYRIIRQEVSYDQSETVTGLFLCVLIPHGQCNCIYYINFFNMRGGKGMDKKPEKIPRNCNECQYFNSCDHAYYGSTNCQYRKEIKEMVRR